MLFQNRLHSFPMLRVGAKAGRLFKDKRPGFLHCSCGNVQLGVSGRRIFGVTSNFLKVRFGVWQFCCCIAGGQTLRRLGRLLFGSGFRLGSGILDLFQDCVVLLRRGLGQAFKEDIRGFQIATKDLQPDAGVEFVRKVYALGKQGCPPDGAGADVVFPCDALAGFLGGLLVFSLICSL